MGGPPAGRRVRVLTLVDYLTEAGGAERLAAEITERLDPSRFERTLCITRPQRPQPSPALHARLERAGVRILELQRRGRFDVAAWRGLLRLLRREVDVVHAHKFGSNVWGMLLGRLAGVPVRIAHEHTWAYEGQPLRRFLDRQVVARFSDAFVAVSRADQRRMIEFEGIRPEDTLFVPNGISPAAARGHDVRAELGIPPEAPVVGTIGTLRAQKALDVFVAAVAKLKEDHPDLRALVAGGGDSGPLEREARRLGIEDRVFFLGRRDDVPDVLASLDVVLSSSDYEGSPLALMEAMEAARPIAATAVGGVTDLIEDGVHGLLVPPRDPAALARAADTLLRDRPAARAMGERARERRAREFDLDVTVRTFEGLYDEVLRRKGAVRDGQSPKDALASDRVA
jgi:glycosyltransferase involved in cell wall biosynthesis